MQFHGAATFFTFLPFLFQAGESPEPDEGRQWVLGPSFNIFEEWSIGKEIGRGQFGVVKKAEHKKSGERCAVKILEKARMLGPADKDDVRREVDILFHLSGHPNVVQLRRTYENRTNIFMVMESCEGGDLFDR